MVIEPPCRALLNLADSLGILETSKNCSDGSVVNRIERVDDGLRKFIGCVHVVKEICHLGGGTVGVNAVISGIRTEFIVTKYIVVSLSTIVKLHCPAQLIVFFAYKGHESSLELKFFFLGNCRTAKSLSKNCFDFFCCCRLKHNILKGVVGCAAAHGIKECHSVYKSFLEGIKAVNLNAAYFG